MANETRSEGGSEARKRSAVLDIDERSLDMRHAEAAIGEPFYT